MGVKAKICGLKTEDCLATAIEGGAAYIGFVFYPPSPRALSPQEASSLGQNIPKTVAKVALTVDAEDALLGEILETAQPDMLQLHGQESPERMQAIRKLSGLPLMKAIPIASKEDIQQARRYESVADILLFDAKPPTSLDAALPGGNGLIFDWSLIAGESWSIPWMLSGGLTAQNVAEAVAYSGARHVDVSSGVESSRGVKDAQLIKVFLETVANL